jgi:4,5-DOPA dioxygenase extradiol
LDFKNNPAPHWVVAFRQWVIDSIQAHNIDALCQFETVAPFSKMNHPTPDHFLPILFAAGAGGLQNAVLIHESMELGTLAMDCWKFDGGQ